MSKNVQKDAVAEPEVDMTEKSKASSSIAWAITVGVLFGAIIGALVGISLRPKEDFAELSHEWLEEFKDVTDRVSFRVQKQVREIVSKKSEQSEEYGEYSETYV